MRVLLADDEARVRSALRLLLEQAAGLDVVGECASGEALAAQIASRCPDLLLLDWELPRLQECGAVSALHAICPALIVIALSGKPEAAKSALAAGADAFVSKGDPPERLLEALMMCSTTKVRPI
jgi:DNA-binding NarL/FixJ family response regulator